MKVKPPVKEPIVFRYAPALVIAVPLLLYLSAMRLGFVYFDDDILILINFDKISDLANLGKAFRTDAFFASLSPYYRPLQNVSFMFESLVGGKSPFIYHLGNVVLHVLTCLSLFRLLGLLEFSRSKTLIATLVYAVHPMIGHAVLWIPARGDIMVTLFGLLSFSYLIRYLMDKKVHLLIFHMICLAGALFSKESGVFFPVLFVLYLLLKKEKIFAAGRIPVYASWMIVLASWYLLRYISIDHRSDGQVGVHALIRNLPFIAEVVSRFFFPFNLPVTPVFSAGYTLGGVVLILGLLLFILLRKGPKYHPLILFGGAWFIGFCLPNMFVRLTSADDNFEYLFHRTYLLSIGFIIMLLAASPEKWFDLQRRPQQLVTGVTIAILFLFSYLQQGKYQDATSYWGSAISYRPDKAWFHYYLGRYWFKQKDNVKYGKYLMAADSLKSYAEFKYQLGMISFADKKDYETAYRYFSDAFRQGYGESEGKANFIALCIESAAYYFQAGDYDKAVERCSEAVRNDPGNADAIYNLGIYHVNKGEKEQAAAMWKRALKLKPELTRAYRSLCLYYRYDAKKADSANWYAREYLSHGGTENLISP